MKATLNDNTFKNSNLWILTVFTLMYKGEAQIVMEHVQRIVSAGVNPREVGVISPYNLQVFNELTRSRCDSYMISIRRI